MGTALHDRLRSGRRDDITEPPKRMRVDHDVTGGLVQSGLVIAGRTYLWMLFIWQKFGWLSKKYMLFESPEES